MPLPVTRGTAQVGALRVGGGTRCRKRVRGAIAVDPPSIAGGATAVVALAIAGVAVEDEVRLTPPPALEAGLVPVGAVVTAPDTVTLTLLNVTAGAIDGAARTWEYTWEDWT